MLLRDWQCLNDRCRAAFHSDDHGNPPCPKCGCLRVSWIPGGGHVGKLQALDRSLNALAKTYGMTNINSGSPSRLDRAMPKHEHVVADGPVLSYAPGFAAPFNRAGFATCEPSHQRVNFKVRQTPEQMSAGTATVRAGPQIGASNWGSIRRAYKK